MPAGYEQHFVDPESGTLLDYGRNTYRPPAALADHVRTRDQTCVFPGCRRPARRCDLDHQVGYPKGGTSAANLGCLCRRHHRCKQHDGWKLVQDGEGRFTWTTPAGRTYVRPPEPLSPPAPEPPPQPPEPEDDTPPF